MNNQKIQRLLSNVSELKIISINENNVVIIDLSKQIKENIENQKISNFKTCEISVNPDFK